MKMSKVKVAVIWKLLACRRSGAPGGASGRLSPVPRTPYPRSDRGPSIALLELEHDRPTACVGAGDQGRGHPEDAAGSGRPRDASTPDEASVLRGTDDGQAPVLVGPEQELTSRALLAWHQPLRRDPPERRGRGQLEVTRREVLAREVPLDRRDDVSTIERRAVSRVDGVDEVADREDAGAGR